MTPIIIDAIPYYDYEIMWYYINNDFYDDYNIYEDFYPEIIQCE